MSGTSRSFKAKRRFCILIGIEKKSDDDAHEQQEKSRQYEEETY